MAMSLRSTPVPSSDPIENAVNAMPPFMQRRMAKLSLAGAGLLFVAGDADGEQLHGSVPPSLLVTSNNLARVDRSKRIAKPLAAGYPRRVKAITAAVHLI